jgi:nucleotide-binding universal stress UspA family protein
MYEKVVVLLDGSDLAEQVLPHVTEIVAGRGGEIHLLSVTPVIAPVLAAGVEVQPLTLAADFLALEVKEQERISRDLQTYLQGVAQRLSPTVGAVQTVVRSGQPAEEILHYAKEVHADLIALCTHGRSGLSRWVFGSVADKVLRGATVPVLLVRVRATVEPGPVSHQRILVPLDGSALAEAALPHVRALIRPGQTQVCLVSVLTTGLGDRTVALLTTSPPGLRLSTTALSRAQVELQSYLRGVAARLREAGAATQIEVREGNPAEEILACAQEIQAGLIVMNAHGLSGMSRWVYGSVADRVLRGASCPVLLVR